MALLDTHKEILHLKEIGFKEKEATAIVALHTRGNENLATKADLKLEISELRSELKTEIKALDMNIKWMMAISLLILGILLKNTFF